MKPRAKIEQVAVDADELFELDWNDEIVAVKPSQKGDKFFLTVVHRGL